MVRDAAAGAEIIGMALLRGDWHLHYQGNPEIFDTGCAGKIVNIEELPDGKFNILLHGLREFTIRRHVFDRLYRQAEVSWRTGIHAGLGEDDRTRLIELLSDFLSARHPGPAHRLLRDRSLSDELLVNFFSYALELEPLEKQGLLQAETLAVRANRLAEIIEFHMEEGRLTVKRSGPDRCH